MKMKDIFYKSNFCPAPWFHVVLNPRGKVRTCNDFKGEGGLVSSDNKFKPVYNNDKFQTLRRKILNNEIHDGCKGCREKEERIGYSKRKSFIHFFERHYGIPDIELTDDWDSNNIMWVDIRISNHCNLKCRHCFPVLSSKWKSDVIALQDTAIGRMYLNDSYDYYLYERADITNNVLDDISNSIGNLSRLEFKGGEPLLKQKEIVSFINNLYCDLSELQLDIVTNGTIPISSELFDIIKQCKKFTMSFSVEGTGKVFKYIRGIDLEIIEPTIKSLDGYDNVVIILRVTQMPYNIFELPNVYHWFEGLNLKNRMPAEAHNYVVTPPFMNPLVLPLELRMQAADFLNDFIKSTPECDKSIKTYCNTLTKPQKEEYFHMFKCYTKDLDKIRGMSILDVEPRVGKYIYD
jgi:MoaA/NifB/PqqE/SkfB family radical SAM enzyme